MSIKRPMPTTWEELSMPQRHIIRTMASAIYDQETDDPLALAMVVWPEKDHTRIHPRSGRHMTEWSITQQLRYLRWYGFVEKTGPIILTELGRKVYAERWDREIDRLLGLRSFLSNGWDLYIVNGDNEEANDTLLAAAFTEWLDKDERTRYLTREWEKMAWKTEPTRLGART